MSGTIVVGVDGNERAEKAAETAAHLAAATGSRLHVVCAFMRNQSVEVDADGTTLELSTARESASTAEGTAARLRTIAPHVTARAVQARPADALLSEAERVDARLIVVGNARVQGIARVLGSIAAAVAHHARCDVYIVNTN